jgi:hypothetical protein
MAPSPHRPRRPGRDRLAPAPATAVPSLRSTPARPASVTLTHVARRYGRWTQPYATGPPPPRAELAAPARSLGAPAASQHAPGTPSLEAAQRLQPPLVAVPPRTPAASVARPPTPPPP